MSSRGYPRTKAVMETRRKEAEARQAAYDALTLQQKLDKLPPEPQAAKVRAKLLAQKNPKFVTAIQKGESQIDTGETSSHEEVKTRLKAKERRALEQ